MNESTWTSNGWRAPVSRRRALRGAALVVGGLSSAALLGCGDSEESGGSPAPTGTATTGGAEGTPTAGGNLRVALVADANTLDPAFSTSTPDSAITLASMDNLTRIEHDATLRPVLAESIEPNADLTEYVVKLRAGVTFHHGKELDATDVRMTFERLLDPDLGSPARAAVESIQGIEEIDPLTLKFVLSAPNAFLADAFAIYQARILPSDIDPGLYATQISGTGPFRLVEHLPGERTVFERNEAYWDGPPPLDSVTFFYMPEPAGRLEALRAGSIEVMMPLEPSQVEGVRSAGLTVSEAPSGGYINLAMRCDREPFTDVRVRQALQAMTDREFIRDATIYGYGEIANDHPIPPFDPHFWEGQTQPGYNVAEAQKLLDAAGHSDLVLDLHTSTVTPGIQELAIAFRELAAMAGVTVNVVRSPEDAYWSNVWLVEPFTTVGWNGRPVDEALSLVYRSGAPWNESYYENPEVDELLVQARGEPDQEARTELYGRIEQTLIDDVPRIVPVFKNNFIGMSTRVRGLEAHPSNWFLLHNAWLQA